MKPSAVIWSISASIGSQKPLILAEDDRLAVMAELGPGHDLDDFLDRADTARQRHEGVGFLEHGMFALMHVVGDDQLVDNAELTVSVASIHEKSRDDAGDLAAVNGRRGGNRAHDALGAAAIDQAQAGFGDRPSQLGSGPHVGVVASRREPQ